MEKNQNTAFVIVDAQRGFMPASEGTRLNEQGFGALGVDGGEKIIPRLNQLTREFGAHGILLTTTQDWHPAETEHFSDEPNYINTWPVHCVAGTLGAELHPELDVATITGLAKRFIKGDVACLSPEDDTSYTGALAYDPTTGLLLPDWLRQNNRDTTYVAGVALGDGDEHMLCVDSTAIDLHRQGFNVTLVSDATEAVMPANRELCLRNLAARGISIVTTEQAIAAVRGK